MSEPKQYQTNLLAIIGLVVAIISAIAAIVVIPEVRAWIGLENSSENSNVPIVQYSTDVSSNFSGKWDTEPNFQNGFYIEMKQDIRGLSAHYSAVALDGNRIDDATLNGVVRSDGTGVISFISSFGGVGKAIMTAKDNILYWNIIEEDGEHFLPKSATLYKVGD